MFIFKVSRFYGWSLKEILKMDSETFYMSLKAINAIESQEMLVNMTIADYPQMKKEDRSSMHRKISKESDPFIKERAVKTSDIKGMFNIEDFKRSKK